MQKTIVIIKQIQTYFTLTKNTKYLMEEYVLKGGTNLNFFLSALIFLTFRPLEHQIRFRLQQTYRSGSGSSK